MGKKGKREKAWKRNRRAARQMARTPQRVCGECTVCCHATEIPWLDKPEFTSCKHLDESKGCTIYSTRPKGCRDFKCLWLASWRGMEFLTEDDRPDKLGIMILASDGSGGHPGADLWELRPGALESDRVQKIIAELRARRCTITETRFDPETRVLDRKLITPTIDGKQVFITDRNNRDNPTYLFGP
jgi:hypothetical protein